MTSAASAAAAAADDDGDGTPASPAETLELILRRLLPFLLSAALSARTLVGRWRLLHSKLSLLLAALSDAAGSPHWPSNQLFSDHLLPSLLSTLRTLRSLSAVCLDQDLPGGKLRLQSDVDIATSGLSLHLHDLHLLLRSGLLHHDGSLASPADDSAAIVLPLPAPSASRAVLALFVRDIFARLQIGALDLKGKALDSLLELLATDPAKISRLVVEEGDLPLLLRLLDPSAHSLLRDRTAAVISILATASDASRHAVFEEGALGPLLRLLDSGPAVLKERAAIAIHALTADHGCAWTVSAYGGVSILVAACHSGSGSPSVQALAAGSLNNAAAIDDVRAAMVEEGAVSVLIELLSGNLEAQKNAALCLASLAAMGGEEIRNAILQENGLTRLLQLLRVASDPEAIDHALKAISACALAVSPTATKLLSSSPPLFAQLTDLIKRGSAGIQHSAAALVANLSPSEDIKRTMAEAMPALIKMMENSKPSSAQEAAAAALTSLVAVRANRRELSRDEKSVTRLVQMLDPRSEAVAGKELPVAVVLALTSGSSGGARRRLAEAGACQHLQKLAEADVPGAKKALQRITGNRLKNLFSISWPQ
ncbi:uncharacterized protein LOC122012294 [Zingiber officinale]|uniref:DUF7032 domain-containing protein n=1 Tax=Zingiber officinale TaxID=94328 RepID=A0A8J5FDD8_ZINOF|nr:uncharacterized protein LOC122012294 [Zingiber officinale]KAG6484860.1 hypothetical protein ZIOFF_053385 [Zingiber officinale]